MTQFKTQSLKSLREEMKSVARRDKAAPSDAAMPSFNSVEALVRLLTQDNRKLLATIRDYKPQSVGDLARITGRAQPNLTRTLAKLEAAGIVTMKAVGRSKAPIISIKKIMLEIDLFSNRDRLRMG